MSCGEPTALRRFFVRLSEPVNALPHSVSVTDEFTVTHARSVLRLKTGDAVLAIDGERGQAYRAEIVALKSGAMTLSLLEAQDSENPAGFPKVTLGAALIKEQRWDWLLQKTTELGVHAIHPLVTARTVIKVNDPEKKQARWQAVVQSAAEQSEGLFLPQVETPGGIEAFCQAVSKIPVKLLLLERGTARKPLCKVLMDLNKENPPELAVVIGPEGGWTAKEVEYFLSQGFQAASLGARILRSETAAIALMSAITYKFDTGNQP